MRRSQRENPQGARSRNGSAETARRDLREEGQKLGRRIESPEFKQISFASSEGTNPGAPNKLLLVATAPNETRLKQANLEDESALG